MQGVKGGTGQVFRNQTSQQTQTKTPQIIMKIIDLRELGDTYYNLKHVDTFLMYFNDWRLRLHSAIFAYCKNSYYCYDGYYHVNFAVIHGYCGHCYNPDDFQQYFLLGLYNKILEITFTRSGKIPTENEVEQKILEFYRTHIKINIRSPIIIYKILEAKRTLWIVKLPDEC